MHGETVKFITKTDVAVQRGKQKVTIRNYWRGAEMLYLKINDGRVEFE
jgi:hypothetical protein